MSQSQLFAPKPVKSPDVRLIHGDCLEEMPKLEAGSVAMVFADLPYGISGNLWDCQINLAQLWKCFDAILCRPANAAFTATNPFAAHLIASNPSMFRYDLVWEKNSAAGFLQAQSKPLRAHELVLLFSHAKALYVPQMVAGQAYSHTSKTAGRDTYRTNTYDNTIKASAQRYPRSVVRYGVARYTDGKHHPTQKPVALLEWLIKTYTNEGDLILDPTAGSGTTAVAALRTGRRSICIEKSQEYYDVMCKRVAHEQTRLRAAQ